MQLKWVKKLLPHSILFFQFNFDSRSDTFYQLIFCPPNFSSFEENPTILAFTIKRSFFRNSIKIHFNDEASRKGRTKNLGL